MAESWGGGGRKISGLKHWTRRPTFFMMPAFRFEKVMWRRDLSLDKLDLDLAALAAALLVVIVVVVGGGALALALDAAALGGGAVVGVVEIDGRRLVVLVGDVGHCVVFFVWAVSSLRRG